MKVILLSDVKKVGRKGEIVEVSDGYARNFLFARKLAVIASETGKKVLDEENARRAALDSELKAKAEEVAKQLATMELSFKVKAKDGRVSGSVSTKQIADELKKAGITVDKRKFIDNEPVVCLGYSNVRIELYKDVIGTIKIRLIEE